MTFARNETRIFKADSNRFDYTIATSGLSVVDVEAAFAGKQAVLGRVNTGLFPQEFFISPDSSVLLVADYASKVIQAVKVAILP